MNVVPNQWYAILDPREVPDGKPVGFRRLGHDLVFWRDTHGKVFAAIDRCPHRLVALSLGTVKAGCLACPFHGFEFATSGACVKVPAHPNLPISPKMHLQMFAVREEHDFLWLWSGPDAPSDAEIPFFDTSGRSWEGSQLQVTWPVHYTRSVENQLDFAHLPFVHRTTIGRGLAPEVHHSFAAEGAHIHIQPNFGEGSIDFYGPNIWKLTLGPKLFNFLAFVPIDDDNMMYYLRAYQKFTTLPGLRWLVGKAMSVLSPKILAQDQAVVQTQNPKVGSLDNGEIYVLSDQPIVAYHKWRRALMPEAPKSLQVINPPPPPPDNATTATGR